MLLSESIDIRTSSTQSQYSDNEGSYFPDFADYLDYVNCFSPIKLIAYDYSLMKYFEGESKEIK